MSIERKEEWAGSEYWGPTYSSWAGMMARCNNPNHEMYKYYGGRGIRVCDRWRSFTNFLADMGERPKSLTLDRIDVELGYQPGNCKWSTGREQRLNQKRTVFYTYNGKTMCLTDWIREITGCDNAEAAKKLRNSRLRR